MPENSTADSTTEDKTTDNTTEPSSPTDLKNTKMKCVRRNSIVDQFHVSPDDPIPTVPIGGARIKVIYAGACYTEKQVLKTGKKRARMAGIHDTSLFPGYEVSGKIDAICNTVEEQMYKIGEKVIVYPEDEDEADSGYAEYVVVKNVRNLIKIPENMSMEIAAMLPTGGLIAYHTVTRIRPFVLDKVSQKPGNCKTNILIVGAGGLGLWILTLAKHLLCASSNLCNKIHLSVADSNIEKLMVAKEHGCTDVLHWNDQLHEEYLLERTKSVCGEGVDILIDFVSSPRTINRALKVMAPGGVLVVGGNSKYEVPFCLHSLAQRQLTIMGISKGSREQLQLLTDCVSKGEIRPPTYTIFPVDEANRVFDQLNQCKISGRAILQVCLPDDEDLA